MAESEPGGEVARSKLRASHDDRDRVVELLRVSAGDGRLTAEELDERLEQAMTARTYGELARLVADLPTAGPVAIPAVAPQAKDVVRIDTRSISTTRSLSSCEARSSLRAISLRAISPPGSDSAMDRTLKQRHARYHAHRTAAPGA